MGSQTWGADSGLFGHPFFALFAASTPHILYEGLGFQKRKKGRLKKGRTIQVAESLASLISGAEGGLFGRLYLALFAASKAHIQFGNGL